MSDTRYGAILCDPPWAFKTYSGKHTTAHRSADEPYATMTAEQLYHLEIPAADNCALFMWVVDAHLPDALVLGSGWGFEYKTLAFVWNKGDRIGMGYWTRKQAEICLLFTRGKPKRVSKAVRQIITSPRREHSRKPDEQYARIEALVSGPYLEMFARQTRKGWASWGLEVNKFDSISNMHRLQTDVIGNATALPATQEMQVRTQPRMPPLPQRTNKEMETPKSGTIGTNSTKTVS